MNETDTEIESKADMGSKVESEAENGGDRTSQPLADLRSQIDEVNDQLLELFERRMDISAKIAACKREQGLPVADPTRERSILAEVAQRASQGMGSYATVLFSLLMEMSRSHQERLLHATSDLKEQVSQALAQTSALFPPQAVVACQGVEGAFSQAACDKLFKHPSIMYFRTFEGVFKAIEEGLCSFGVLPLENSSAGSVNRVYDLMMSHEFHIVRTARVKVDHCLLASPGAELDGIREVYSHAQAIQQCSTYLEGLQGVKVIPMENTAQAAQMVARSGRTDVAAIASRACADLYGLRVLARSVQNEGNNYTRFACIAKDLQIYPGADRTSLMMVLPHRPGSLYKALARFYALDINLTKLESRPLPDRDFEFMFYFDLETPVAAPEFADLLCELDDLCEEFKYLGSYSEIA